MSKLHRAQTQQGHSRHFFELIKCIGEAKSKQEEDKLIIKDLVELKKSLSEKTIDKKLMKEYVVRAMYAEMLGHRAEFAYIHAVTLTSSSDLLFKRTGYLGTWLCVNPDSEVMYLIVSNLQRDMKSHNFLEVCAALTSASKLLRHELMVCLTADVTALLSHTNALVRKKAVLCLHSFHRRSEGLVSDPKSFRAALCDRDPSVMGVTLQFFYDASLTDPTAQSDLLSSFLSILKQITEHRLSREFDYHRVPAPWMQIKLLRIIAVLVGDDKAMAERCAEPLLEALRRADTGLNIGHAVMFEAVRTITAIYPLPDLLEVAADTIAKFLSHNNANLKYLGITALSSIVKVDRKYAQHHQQIVIGCLEDADETIRSNTVTLLLAMCNEHNVEAIVGRLLKVVPEITDTFGRQHLVKSLCDVSESHYTSATWLIKTLNKLIEMAGDSVPSATIQGLLKLIAEGEGDDEASDAELRTECVESYFSLMDHRDRAASASLSQVAAWVMGEYGFLTRKVSRHMLLDRMCDMLERPCDTTTKEWVVSAITKVVAQLGKLPLNVEDIIQRAKDSRSVNLQQRCYELLELASMPSVMAQALPLDGCCEDIAFDDSLSFLDGIVRDAIAGGAAPYRKREAPTGPEAGALRTDAYKSQRPDVVDESDLTMERFDRDEDAKLVIREGAKRWGAANLTEEVAIDAPTLPPVDPEVSEPVTHTDDAPSTRHVDPVAVPEPRKPTKNEKFINDIFSAGGETRKKPRQTKNRAVESRRRAEEAARATAKLDAEDAALAPAPALPTQTTAENRGVPQKGSGSGVKLQTTMQKQVVRSCIRMRFGVMGETEFGNVKVNISPPPNCAIEDITTSIPQAVVRGSTVSFPYAPAKTPAFIEFSVSATTFPNGGGTTATVTCSSPSGDSTAKGMVPLAPTDLLRQSSITPDAFGKLWAAQTQESKVSLRFPQPINPDQLQKHIGERASLKILQVIGRECIAAATVVPCDFPLLGHFAVDGQTIHATIRCASKEFSDAIARLLQP